MRDWRDPALLPNARNAGAGDAGEDDDAAGVGRDPASPHEPAATRPEGGAGGEVEPPGPLHGHLHILVESASGLPDKTSMLQKDRPNPLAQVTFGAQTQSTKAADSTNAPHWNEELVWDKVTVGGPLEPSFPLAVQVFSQGYMGRPGLLGSATHQMAAAALKGGAQQEVLLTLAPKEGKKASSAGTVRLRVWLSDRADKGGEAAAVRADDAEPDASGERAREGARQERVGMPAYIRSLLPYGRPLFTLTHTAGMLV